MTSAVLIVPADALKAANALGAVMGWGPNNYTIRLSDNGKTVTHWACRIDLTDDQIVAVQDGAKEIGLTVDLSESLWGADHLAEAMATRGLSLVEDDPL